LRYDLQVKWYPTFSIKGKDHFLTSVTSGIGTYYQAILENLSQV
jgi:hypothetical protein